MSAEAGEVFCDRSHTASPCAEMPGLNESHHNVHTALHVACNVMPDDSSADGGPSVGVIMVQQRKDFGSSGYPALFAQDCSSG